MKTTTTTAALVPLPLVPPGPGPIRLGARLRRRPHAAGRSLAPEPPARADPAAPVPRHPQSQPLPPAVDRPRPDVAGPRAPIARLLAPETHP
jgi:hypothetical protein